MNYIENKRNLKGNFTQELLAIPDVLAKKTPQTHHSVYTGNCIIKFKI